MTKQMVDTLEEWLSKNFCPIIETAGTVVCRLKYVKNNIKRDIAIAFTRYHHSDDATEYIIGDAGYVLTVPSFWLSVPKELVIPYISSYVDTYISELTDYSSTSTGTSTGNNPCATNNCCKTTSTPPKVFKPPVEVANCIPCSDGQLKNYYVTNTEVSSDDTSTETSSTGTFTNTQINS